MRREGNCYAVSEAAYHILGGRRAGWKVMRLKIQNERFNHWFLLHETGIILDLSRRQFKHLPDYAKAIGTGFLTKKPSKRGRQMITTMTWQEVKED